MGGIVVLKFILVTDHLRQGGCLQNLVSDIFNTFKGDDFQSHSYFKDGWLNHYTRFRLVISSSSLMTWPLEVMMGRRAASWLASR